MQVKRVTTRPRFFQLLISDLNISSIVILNSIKLDDIQQYTTTLPINQRSQLVGKLSRDAKLSLLHYDYTIHTILNYYAGISRLITEEIFRDRMESSPINVTGLCQELTSLPIVLYIDKKRGKDRENGVSQRDSRELYRETLHLKALYPNRGFPSFAVRLDFPGYGYGYRKKS